MESSWVICSSHASHRWAASAAGLVALLLATGCGDAGYDVAPVTGTVTLDGKPFVWGSVMFAPIQASAANADAGKPAFGMLDAQGHFALSTYADQDGAVVGDHRVTVFCVDDGPNGAPPTTVPRFLRIALRGDAMTVAAGKDNHFAIALTSDDLKKYGSSR